MSKGTLIGIDQLVLGACAACDFLDLDGRVVIPAGSTITPQLVAQIKDAGVIGLVTSKSDCMSHRFAVSRPSFDAVQSRIVEMQRRSGITGPLSPATLKKVRETLASCFDTVLQGSLPDPKELDSVITDILHDIELIENAPMPYLCKTGAKLKDRLVDGAINMAVLLAWHCRQRGESSETVRAAALGGLLYDTGLLFVSQKIVERTTELSNSEFREIKRHPYLGVRAFLPLGKDLPQIARDVILHHHEREDGEGYPLRKAGTSVPEIARLAHVIDSYIGLVSPRPHRAPYPPHKAIDLLLTESGKSFNQAVLKEFIERTGRYPLGSTVVLSTNEVGVVVGQVEKNPFRPIVDVYFTRHHQFCQSAMRVDLSKEHLKYVRQVMR